MNEEELARLETEALDAERRERDYEPAVTYWAGKVLSLIAEVRRLREQIALAKRTFPFLRDD